MKQFQKTHKKWHTISQLVAILIICFFGSTTVFAGTENDGGGNTLAKLIMLVVLGWIVFSIIFSISKGKSGGAIVFADYTDVALTFMSITVFPIVIGLIAVLFKEELGQLGDTILGYLIVGQFFVILGFSFRNLYYLNNSNLFVAATVLTGRLVLSITLLSLIGQVFSDQRSLVGKLFFLVLSGFLGSLLHSLILKEEFTSFVKFFDKENLTMRFPADFLESYARIAQKKTA